MLLGEHLIHPLNYILMYKYRTIRRVLNVKHMTLTFLFRAVTHVTLTLSTILQPQNILVCNYVCLF